jgi:hypothetical protein
MSVVDGLNKAGRRKKRSRPRREMAKWCLFKRTGEQAAGREEGIRFQHVSKVEGTPNLGGAAAIWCVRYP